MYQRHNNLLSAHVLPGTTRYHTRNSSFMPEENEVFSAESRLLLRIDPVWAFLQVNLTWKIVEDQIS